MEPVPLIFSCDTEDYETPASDDAELLWATLFARHDVKACFCVVGEEARALRERGRRDVLEAIGRHEVASHSNMHSAHPTPAEYLEMDGWDEGVRRFLVEESAAVRDLHDILGQRPSAWCKPGNSWGPAVAYAAPLLGIPVFCDAPFEWAPGRPLRYAGSMLLKYHTSFDRYFAVPAAERLQKMQADFKALLESRRADAAREGGAPGAIVMYTHPCRTFTAAFPSNFTAGANPPRQSWQPAPLRPQAEVDALVRDFGAFLFWIGGLRAAGEVALTTYAELAAQYREPSAPWLATAQVAALAEEIAAHDGSLPPRRVAGSWLSPAEQLGVLVWTLAAYERSDALPAQVAVRRLLGPVEGIEPAPPTERTLSATPLAELAAAAARVSQQAAISGAVPAFAEVAGVPLRPATLLALAARALVRLRQGADLASAVEVPAAGAGEYGTALAEREDFQRLRYQHTWSIFRPEFTGERLLAQARWQTWSAKPA